jgi:predicted RNA binding protein YcfA (HicA-like mRNA interferase family)
MPPVTPSVPGTKVVRALERAGFKVTRIRGSHRMMRHPHGRVVSVLVHSGRGMPKGTLRGIPVIVGMDIEEFRELL